MKERRGPTVLFICYMLDKSLGAWSTEAGRINLLRPGVSHIPMLEEKGWAHLLFDPPYVSKLASYLWSDRIIVKQRYFGQSREATNNYTGTVPK